MENESQTIAAQFPSIKIWDAEIWQAVENCQDESHRKSQLKGHQVAFKLRKGSWKKGFPIKMSFILNKCLPCSRWCSWTQRCPPVSNVVITLIRTRKRKSTIYYAIMHFILFYRSSRKDQARKKNIPHSIKQIGKKLLYHRVRWECFPWSRCHPGSIKNVLSFYPSHR